MSTNKATSPKRKPQPVIPVVAPYNPLLDKNLRQFFSHQGVQKQLYQIGLIDAEGRVLDTGGSTSKLSVVDKEIKRMGQQEDDLAKEEAELRARVRELRLRKLQEEQHARRLALVKEEERIRQEVIRLVKDSASGGSINSGPPGSSVRGSGYSAIMGNQSVLGGGVFPPPQQQQQEQSIGLAVGGGGGSISTTHLHPESDNEDDDEEYGVSRQNKAMQSVGAAGATSITSGNQRHNNHLPPSSTTNKSMMSHYNSNSPKVSSSVTSPSSPPPPVGNASSDPRAGTTSSYFRATTNSNNSNNNTQSPPSGGGGGNSNEISSDLMTLLRNRSETTNVKLPSTPQMHTKRPQQKP